MSSIAVNVVDPPQESRFGLQLTHHDHTNRGDRAEPGYPLSPSAFTLAASWAGIGSCRT